MGLLNTLTYDGRQLSEFGAFISGSGVFNSPARIGEMVHIPGRNGSIWMDEGCFENIEITYPAFIGTQDAEEFRTKLRNLRTWLNSRNGYCRLEDTYHPDEYRTAVFRNAIETDPKVYNRAGSFEIKFDSKPQRWLKIGDEPVTFTENGTISNPTMFESKPVIAVTGNGKINIGGNLITVSDTTQTIYIDSELMDAFIPAGVKVDLTDEEDETITDELLIPIEVYKGGPKEPISMNSHVSFSDYEFPTIPPGENTVAFTSGIESVVIYPRWWYL